METAEPLSAYLIGNGTFCLYIAVPTALATIVAASPIQAQQQVASTPVPDSSGDIVVTAQKREERLQKVPISIAVLSGKALDQQVSGGTLEALNQVPGVSQTTTDIGNATTLSIRGVAPGSPFLDGSPTVGYYLDSIPFSLVKSSSVPNSNAYDMSRVEVLRGPQGTLYGASALNGVVRLITNDADPSHVEIKARAGVSATQGGDPSFRTDAAINVPIIQDKLAIRVVGGVEQQGGWINQTLRHKTDANSSLSRNLRIKVDARPTDNLKIDLSAWFSREKDDAPSYSIDGKTQLTPLPIPQTTSYDAYNGKVTYDLPFMSISSSTSYLRLRRTSYSDYTFITPTSQLYSNLPASVFSEEVLANSNGSGPWRWSAGAFFRDAHDDLFQTLPPVLPGPIYWRDSSKSYAAFGQITRAFADDHFEISGGLRYFHDKVGIQELPTAGGFLPLIGHTEQYHAVTPRVVATWLPSQKLTVYASYSQGFRSGFNQSPLALLAAPGLASVQADKLNNYEVGAKGSLLGGFATYEAAVYYIKWNGVQQSGEIVFNGVIIGASINGSSASGAGTDLSLTLHPTSRVQVGGGLSYNDLQQDHAVKTPDNQTLYFKGDRLAYSAAFSADAFADYTVPLNDSLDAHINLTASYHSPQSINLFGTPTAADPFPDPIKNSSGRPLFVDASVDLVSHTNKTVSLYVHNLTNWNGLIVPAADARSPFRTRPRTVGIQFEAKF